MLGLESAVLSLKLGKTVPLRICQKVAPIHISSATIPATNAPPIKPTQISAGTSPFRSGI